MKHDPDLQPVMEKIDRLNLDAWDVRVSDSPRSLVLSEEASVLAKSIHYTRGIAEGLRTLGFTYIRLSKHEQALQYLEESLALFESLEDKRGQSDIFEYFGIIHRSLGNYKSSLETLFRSLELRQETKYQEGESLSNYHLGVTYRYIGNLDQALEYLLRSLSVARLINYWVAESYSLNIIGSIYLQLEDYDNALEYFQQSLAIRKKEHDKWGEAGCLDNMGVIYFKKGDPDKAIASCQDSLAISNILGDKKGASNSLFHLAEIYYSLGDHGNAFEYAQNSLAIREAIGDKRGQAEIYTYLAEIAPPKDERAAGEPLKFLNKALVLAAEIRSTDLLFKIHYTFYEIHRESGRIAEALSHLELSNTFEKEFHSNALNQKILNLEISHQVENARKEAEIYKLRNIELADLYEESKKRREDLQKTLIELRSAQAQLIHSEKMASLGELTAGIAHEIQNPLNFVNNFSEINTELIAEMKQQIDNGKFEEVKAIANDIRENEEKISHHGKRADTIVKGMLQHSRTSNGQKQPTDVNALAEEYLRLSYHGLRAKDKSFNANVETDFDGRLESMNIIPQDIGRVLLNLLNNAFYSVAEKKKRIDDGYVPKVSLATRSIFTQTGQQKGAEIRIRDNGAGIPQKAIDKIFQPFFTTKPTGQGTGLGLSLSYDIIKTHGGELKVETKENDYAEFIIHLPSYNS